MSDTEDDALLLPLVRYALTLANRLVSLSPLVQLTETLKWAKEREDRQRQSAPFNWIRRYETCQRQLVLGNWLEGCVRLTMMGIERSGEVPHVIERCKWDAPKKGKRISRVSITAFNQQDDLLKYLNDFNVKVNLKLSSDNPLLDQLKLLADVVGLNKSSLLPTPEESAVDPLIRLCLESPCDFIHYAAARYLRDLNPKDSVGLKDYATNKILQLESHFGKQTPDLDTFSERTSLKIRSLGGQVVQLYSKLSKKSSIAKTGEAADAVTAGFDKIATDLADQVRSEIEAHLEKVGASDPRETFLKWHIEAKMVNLNKPSCILEHIKQRKDDAEIFVKVDESCSFERDFTLLKNKYRYLTPIADGQWVRAIFRDTIGLHFQSGRYLLHIKKTGESSTSIHNLEFGANDKGKIVVKNKQLERVVRVACYDPQHRRVALLA
eukprot:GHVN01043823.1.p1 GENE.GHVN01043823.1~~GHVN01043823.1.p1  ORF type:complete len:437 (+),score=48.36 GHVN01043823.1:392-1702(+)